jgi:hypothetical protein
MTLGSGPTLIQALASRPCLPGRFHRVERVRVEYDTVPMHLESRALAIHVPSTSGTSSIPNPRSRHPLSSDKTTPP